MFVLFAGIMDGAIEGAIIGGIAGALAGLGLLVFNLFRTPKLCPECQAKLPMGTVKKCPKCGCRLNAKGEKEVE